MGFSEGWRKKRPLAVKDSGTQYIQSQDRIGFQKMFGSCRIKPEMTLRSPAKTIVSKVKKSHLGRAFQKRSSSQHTGEKEKQGRSS